MALQRFLEADGNASQMDLNLIKATVCMRFCQTDKHMNPLLSIAVHFAQSG